MTHDGRLLHLNLGARDLSAIPMSESGNRPGMTLGLLTSFYPLVCLGFMTTRESKYIYKNGTHFHPRPTHSLNFHKDIHRHHIPHGFYSVIAGRFLQYPPTWQSMPELQVRPHMLVQVYMNVPHTDPHRRRKMVSHQIPHCQLHVSDTFLLPFLEMRWRPPRVRPMQSSQSPRRLRVHGWPKPNTYPNARGYHRATRNPYTRTRAP